MIAPETVSLLPSRSINEALKQINETGLGILVICDANNHLLGVLTDGDIRRGLLRGLSLSDRISEIVNRDPVFLSPTSDTQTQIEYAKEMQLKWLPEVDGQRQFLKLCDVASVSLGQIQSRVLLMAGGLGSRLKPLTLNCPKPLLKIGGKPFIEQAIINLKKQGFLSFIVSTHYKSEMIKEALSDGTRLGVDIEYLDEMQPMGTAGSLQLLENIDHPLLMLNGDILTNLDFRGLLEYHNAQGADLTLCARQYEIEVPYGVIESEPGSNVISSISEKPVLHFDISAGIYIIGANVLATVKKMSSPIDMPDLINQLLENQFKLSLFRSQNYWLDIGSHQDLSKAQDDIVWLWKNNDQG